MILWVTDRYFVLTVITHLQSTTTWYVGGKHDDSKDSMQSKITPRCDDRSMSGPCMQYTAASIV